MSRYVGQLTASLSIVHLLWWALPARQEPAGMHAENLIKKRSYGHPVRRVLLRRGCYAFHGIHRSQKSYGMRWKSGALIGGNERRVDLAHASAG